MNESAPRPWPVNGRNFFVYVYHYIDHTPGLKPASVPDFLSNGSCEAQVPAVKEVFMKAGWEGDGKIEIFAIPPVVSKGSGPDGFIIWHVKQGNNGTSWLASELPLPEIENLVGVPSQTTWP